MTFDDKIRDENCNMILRGKQQKYQDYCQVKLINTGEKILPRDQSKMVEQAKVIYSPLGKSFEKQKLKQLEIKKKSKPQQLNNMKYN